jgi:gamma-glutamylcyclotransferase (GGCT)/AIG2-like uncharacterized protein YtfP
MIPGDDRVSGELWRFDPSKIETVLETLDQIEGTNQPGQDDLYRRVEVEVRTLQDTRLGNAWVYHYAGEPIRDGFSLVTPDPQRCARWP